MSFNVLFLDDDENRQYAFRSNVPSAKRVYNAADAIAALPANSWHYVFLDHDLGGNIFQDSSESNTGMEVVRFLCENKLPIEKIIVHSLNTSAANYMCIDLERAGYTVIRLPFIYFSSSGIYLEVEEKRQNVTSIL
jgi:hypothetical protein